MKENFEFKSAPLSNEAAQIEAKMLKVIAAKNAGVAKEKIESYEKLSFTSEEYDEAQSTLDDLEMVAQQEGASEEVIAKVMAGLEQTSKVAMLLCEVIALNKRGIKNQTEEIKSGYAESRNIFRTAKEELARIKAESEK